MSISSFAERRLVTGVILGTLLSITIGILVSLTPCHTHSGQHQTVAESPTYACPQTRTSLPCLTAWMRTSQSNIPDVQSSMDSFKDSLEWSQCVFSESPITTQLAFVSTELANQIKHKTVSYLNDGAPEKAVMLLKGAIAHGTLTTNQTYVFSWFLGEALKECAQDIEAISVMKNIVAMWKQLESPQRHQDDYALSAARDLAHYYIREGEYALAIDYVRLLTQAGLGNRRPAQLRRAQLNTCLNMLINCDAMIEAQELLEKHTGDICSQSDVIYWRRRISQTDNVAEKRTQVRRAGTPSITIRRIASRKPMSSDEMRSLVNGAQQ